MSTKSRTRHLARVGQPLAHVEPVPAPAPRLLKGHTMILRSTLWEEGFRGIDLPTVAAESGISLATYRRTLAKWDADGDIDLLPCRVFNESSHRWQTEHFIRLRDTEIGRMIAAISGTQVFDGLPQSD